MRMNEQQAVVKYENLSRLNALVDMGWVNDD